MLVSALLGGIIPDFDFLPGMLMGDMRAFHHGISHSLAVAIVFGALILLLIRCVDRTIAVSAAMVAALAYSSHVILDFVTVNEGTRGVPLFWPLSEDQWGLNLHLFGYFRYEASEGLSSIVRWSNLAPALRELFILGTIVIVLLAKEQIRRRFAAPRTQSRVTIDKPAPSKPFHANLAGQVMALRMTCEGTRWGAGSVHRLWQVGLGAGLVLAVVLGTFGRLNGLGNFPLAVDEYYFIQSVKAILAHGVPVFDTGGYYNRGLLLQYLTAASMLLFGDGGFAYRLPAALFSLATVPLAYIYGKKLLGSTGGVVLSGLLLISAWEIEFGRFARMYSALQFFTLLFFIAIYKASESRDRRWTYVPHLVVLTASFVHEFAILLVPFLAVPAFVMSDRLQWGRGLCRFPYVFVTSATGLLCYYIFTFDVGFIGVTNPYPADLELAAGSGRWRLPLLPFFDAGHKEVLLRLGASLAGVMVIGYAALRRMGKPVHESDLLAGLVLLSAAFHQFLIAGAVFVVLAARHRVLDFGRTMWRTHVMLAATVTALFWLVYAIGSQAWIADTFRPEYGYSSNYTLTKALIRAFAGWPVIIDSVIVPWMDDLPLIGACAVAAALYQIISKAQAGLASWAKSPLVFIAVVVVAFGLQASPYSSIRYSFFIYPFVLALILMSAIEAASAVVRRRGGDERLGNRIGVLACAVIFMAGSDDFHMRQIMEVAGPEVRLRLGEFERYESIWYHRLDYESPAVFINERSGAREGDSIVVVGQEPVSFYLRRPHAVYWGRHQNIFWDVSRVAGTIDRWSNQRLLSTPEELRAYTRCAANVWIVRAVSPVRRPFEFDEVWQQQPVREAEVFRSVDGRLVVIQVQLEPGSDC